MVSAHSAQFSCPFYPICAFFASFFFFIVPTKVSQVGGMMGHLRGAIIIAKRKGKRRKEKKKCNKQLRWGLKCVQYQRNGAWNHSKPPNEPWERYLNQRGIAEQKPTQVGKCVMCGIGNRAYLRCFKCGRASIFILMSNCTKQLSMYLLTSFSKSQPQFEPEYLDIPEEFKNIELSTSMKILKSMVLYLGLTYDECLCMTYEEAT